VQDKYKDDLQKALGVPESCAVRDVVVVVREVNMAGLRQFTRACAPFLSAFDDPDRMGVKIVDGKPSTPEGFKFFELVAEHSTAFIDVAVLVTDAPRAWLEAIPPDDFMIIADKIVEVNSRFFAHRLAPALVRLGASLATHLGSSLSKLSSEGAIDWSQLASTPTVNSSDSTQQSLPLSTSNEPTAQ
jgi:hypothetical protein